MALHELLRVFERDTDGEVRAILDAGDAEAARVLAEAERERADRVATAVAAFARHEQAAADAQLAAGEHRARAGVLVARAAMLQRVREAIAVELQARFASDPQLAELLDAAACACAGGEQGELARVATGVVLELPSGTRIEASLAAVLDRYWPRLACEALALERGR